MAFHQLLESSVLGNNIASPGDDLIVIAMVT